MNAELLPPKPKVPTVISIATAHMKPLLEQWRNDNADVPWSTLIRRALKKELRPYLKKKVA